MALKIRTQNQAETRISPYSIPQAHRPEQKSSIQPIELYKTTDKTEGVISPPKPHKSWKNTTVIIGHTGWVKCIDVDPSNEFFVTGSSDHSIKIWDLAKSTLNLTLLGHTGSVQDVKLSKQSPYLFSCCDAKQILCWDLTKNALIRNYYGHLSGVYCLALHPTLDIFASGGRDSVARIWDIRTRQNVFTLEGHELPIFDVLMEQTQPNVITASGDSTVRTYDLRNQKCTRVITNHAKAVKALVSHPSLQTFCSASADSIFQWSGENSAFYKEFKHHRAIINAMSINCDDVLVTAGDDGTLKFWDFGSGQCFQSAKTIPQSGSLECESGIFDCTFDMTGTRFITCEVDKTIKIWKEE